MKHYCAMLMLVLAAGAAQAITVAPAAATPEVLMSDVGSGVVEQVDGLSFKVKGKFYFLSGTAAIYERDGSRGSAHRVVKGRAVTFTVIDDASKNRIKQLWLNN